MEPVPHPLHPLPSLPHRLLDLLFPVVLTRRFHHIPRPALLRKYVLPITTQNTASHLRRNPALPPRPWLLSPVWPRRPAAAPRPIPKQATTVFSPLPNRHRCSHLALLSATRHRLLSRDKLPEPQPDKRLGRNDCPALLRPRVLRSHRSNPHSQVAVVNRLVIRSGNRQRPRIVPLGRQ